MALTLRPSARLLLHLCLCVPLCVTLKTRGQMPLGGHQHKRFFSGSCTSGGYLLAPFVNGSRLFRAAAVGVTVAHCFCSVRTRFSMYCLMYILFLIQRDVLSTDTNAIPK